MKEFSKPTIWKIIAAVIITILEVHVVNYCHFWAFVDGNFYYDACDISILMMLISMPIYILGLQNTPLLYLVSFLYVYFIIHILSLKLIEKYRKEDGTLNLYETCRSEVAEWRCIHFPMGVIMGSVLLIILMNVIPIFAPIIAGIIAGISAYKSRHSNSAGFIAGTLGGLVYLLLFYNSWSYSPNFGFFESIIWRTPIIFEASFLYFGIFGLMGGALGGLLYTHMSGMKSFLAKRDYL